MEQTAAKNIASLLLQATATGTASDTAFLSTVNEDSMRAHSKPPELVTYLGQILSAFAQDQQAQAEFLLMALNEGNFLDMECERARQESEGASERGIREWQ